MGSIFARTFKNRKTYRVQIRPYKKEAYRTTFDSYEEAKEFVSLYEQMYKSGNITLDQLKRKRAIWDGSPLQFGYSWR